jgi:hypothetical protein
MTERWIIVDHVLFVVDDLDASRRGRREPVFSP